MGTNLSYYTASFVPITNQMVNAHSSAQLVAMLYRSKLAQESLRFIVSMETPFLFQELSRMYGLQAVVPRHAQPFIQ